MRIEAFWAVVPAGGAGTRLWPLSRTASPKFLHDLTGQGRSLLGQTRDRLAPMVEDRFLVVTGEGHRAAVLEQLADLAPEAVLAEPAPRDSMAAIGLAAAHLELRARRTGEDVVLGSFPADHVITDPDVFADVVRRAVTAARADWLVTIGIEPTFASPAFGYIRQGEPVPDLDGTYGVREFVEKPSAPVAEEYLAAGHYRWNAGMFVVRPGTLLDLLAGQDPDFAATLRAIAAEPERMPELWRRLPRVAIDHAVAEPAAAEGRVVTVPGDFGWEDVGDFDALGTLLGDREQLLVLGGADGVVGREASGVVVPASGRTIAVVGLDDVVVVDTPDALLVTSRDRAQDVRHVVEQLRDRGSDLT